MRDWDALAAVPLNPREPETRRAWHRPKARAAPPRPIGAKSMRRSRRNLQTTTILTPTGRATRAERTGYAFRDTIRSNLGRQRSSYDGRPARTSALERSGRPRACPDSWSPSRVAAVVAAVGFGGRALRVAGGAGGRALRVSGARVDAVGSDEMVPADTEVLDEVDTFHPTRAGAVLGVWIGACAAASAMHDVLGTSRDELRRHGYLDGRRRGLSGRRIRRSTAARMVGRQGEVFSRLTIGAPHASLEMVRQAEATFTTLVLGREVDARRARKVLHLFAPGNTGSAQWKTLAGAARADRAAGTVGFTRVVHVARCR